MGVNPGSRPTEGECISEALEFVAKGGGHGDHLEDEVKRSLFKICESIGIDAPNVKYAAEALLYRINKNNLPVIASKELISFGAKYWYRDMLNDIERS
jgi:hypothetical protein